MLGVKVCVGNSCRVQVVFKRRASGEKECIALSIPAGRAHRDGVHFKNCNEKRSIYSEW